MSVEGRLFWSALRTGGHQVRSAGASVVGLDYGAIERLATAAGCSAAACAFFFDAAETAAVSAIHERLKDGQDG
ncbi:DUF7697 family protein [Ancylobacter mangrovi]|uniref:DUF7697 family protein n=1 Tax=Ancylobacter mangrovi TaxID=2972472 RepID=UPI0021619EA5|nr:hypothetical protein [Ancylobacter mangrovi]MCS0501378.1 hypothetical protein [Ancylobacter mangrovi]